MTPPDHHKDVMLDIETMSVKSNALVLSVGMVSFTIKSEGPVLGRRELWVPNHVEQLLMNRHIAPSTQKWWSEQPMEARSHWLNPKATYSVARMLNEIAEFVVPYERVWSQGIVFDIGIMESLYGETQIRVPWHYRAPRDARTIRDEFPELRQRPANTVQVGAAHHPVYDCIEQIWDLWQKWPTLPAVPPVSVLPSVAALQPREVEPGGERPRWGAAI